MSAVFSIRDIIACTGGRLLQPGAGGNFVGVSTDSRTAQAGEIFIPLRGERFDGHDFIDRAIKRGVRALVAAEAWWQRQNHQFPTDLTIVLVPETLRALGDLAHCWRQRFSGPVIAITGSCGKTTTKEMIALVLASRFRVLKNELNLNNLIGLPQTLLALNTGHETAVVEMGMNHFGEIRRLAQIARPDIAVVTNVHAAHLEGLGSLEGVAQAKAEVIQGLRNNGLIIYNADDQRLRAALHHFKGQTLSFGFDPGAQIQAGPPCQCGVWGQRAEIRHQGKIWALELQLPGRHQLYNALAAAAVGLALGLPAEQISQALSRFAGLKHRSQMQCHTSGIHIFNDCYNANPGSMAMALQTLASLKNQGRAVAALGDMLELGRETIPAHRQLGTLAAQLQVDLLVVWGKFKDSVRQGALAAGMPHSRIYLVASHAEGADIIRGFCRPGDTLLVKGSRGATMEKLLACL
ncbi:UDP-N-acetylmuramoyl-tripeptide--D-alanyl-D-alanine ligase [Desulfobacca acetoxidans]